MCPKRADRVRSVLSPAAPGDPGASPELGDHFIVTRSTTGLIHGEQLTQLSGSETPGPPAGLSGSVPPVAPVSMRLHTFWRQEHRCVGAACSFHPGSDDNGRAGDALSGDA